MKSNPSFCRFFIVLMALLLFINQWGFGQKYARTQIFFDDAHTPAMLAALGLECDHGHHADNYIINDFSDIELRNAQQQGFNTKILIADVQSHYANQNNNNNNNTNQSRNINTASDFCDVNNYFAVPPSFALGSYGGYFTYTEMLQQLDAMAAQYPQLIKPRSTISDTLKTYNNNPLYWFKISDNPNANEAEPEILYTAIHHAREPLSMSQLIYMAWYMLDNYATNPDIKFLIDNTELYFVPCINPDGYMYNETTDPQGGGMWRKNREPNADGSIGTDLNRNYGYNWGIDDIGSSPVGSSDLYRGTAGFSAAETRLMRLFCNQHSFKIALNAHSYGNLLIYPWGYNNAATNDSTEFRNLSKISTQHNRSKCGTAIETVNYNVNGTSDDWMYGEQTSKPKILAMTPESGTYQTGFYPPSSDIIYLCQSYMLQNLRMAFALHDYAFITERSVDYINNAATNTNLVLNYQQLSINNNVPTQIIITPLVPNAQAQSISNNFGKYQNININATVPDDALGCYATIGYEISTKISANGYATKDTIYKYYNDNSTVLLNENFTNGNNWNLDATWSIAQGNLTDSRNAQNTSNNGYVVAAMQMPVALATVANVKNRFYVSFDARWDIGQVGGVQYVQAFIDGGGGMARQPLCLSSTQPANMYEPVLAGAFSPVFVGTQSTYLYQEADISNYAGQNVLISFEFFNDGTPFEGITIDNLKITRTTTNCGNVGNDIISDAVAHIYLSTQNGLQGIEFDADDLNKNVLIIYDVLGKKVFEKSVIADEIVHLNLPKNMYVYQLAGAKGKFLSFEF